MFTHRKLAYCKTGEAAELLGVSLRTVQLWVDAGILEAWLTEGGHRRIRLSSVNRLLNSKTSAPEFTEPVEEPISPSATEASAARSSLKLLLADDDTELLRQYKRKIESWHLPVDVSVADDGYEALLRVGRDTPDLMVADLGLSGMDGHKLLTTLTQSSYSSQTEIVVLTTSEIQEASAEAQGLRRIHKLPKAAPFAPLRKLLEQMIARRAAA